MSTSLHIKVNDRHETTMCLLKYQTTPIAEYELEFISNKARDLNGSVVLSYMINNTRYSFKMNDWGYPDDTDALKHYIPTSLGGTRSLKEIIDEKQ